MNTCAKCNSSIVLKLLSRVSYFNKEKSVYTDYTYSCDCESRSYNLNVNELVKEYPSIWDVLKQ